MELKTKVIETKKLLMLTDRKENSEFDLILESIDVPLQIEYKIDLTAQTRVDGEYPKDEKKRSEITELDISKENLQGKLNLKGFTNLKELDCHDNQLTELDISDCPNLEVLYCSSNQLSGLDLSNCPNLKTIDCGFNELTNLDLTNLSHLEELSCNDNLITKLELSSLNSEKLTSLNISDNNFSEQDLEIFGEFTNLENLLIGNEDKKKIEQGIYNRFFNSLEPLKNLTKLELLFISNTDIDSGLKFLPDSLEEIYCSFKERPESKVKTLAERLSDFSIDEDKGKVIDEIKKRGYIQRNQEVHDIKPNFSTKENKRYGLLFVFESGGSKGYLSSAKKYVGIFFRYNASSGKIEEIIDGNVKLDVDEITSASSEKKEEKEEAEQTAKDRANINKKVRELSRKILLRRLDECQNKCYKANNELEILSKEITSHVVRIFILELDQEINDETLPGYIRDICNKEIENSVNHINEKIKNYIEEANSNNSFL
ncbi:18482_t:CDS:2, partial [Racocetra persica]